MKLRVNRNQSGNPRRMASQRPYTGFAAWMLLLTLAAAPAAARQQVVDPSACLDAPIDEVVEVCSRLVEPGKIEGNLLATIYLSRGFVRLGRGEYVCAVEELDNAIRIDPSRAEALALRAEAYNGLGQFARAIADFDEAIRLAPENAQAFAGRGAAYFNNGDRDRALHECV